jgi:hypothetical protein
MATLPYRKSTENPTDLGAVLPESRKIWATRVPWPQNPLVPFSTTGAGATQGVCLEKQSSDSVALANGEQ